jgi:hypothetical protein
MIGIASRESDHARCAAAQPRHASDPPTRRKDRDEALTDDDRVRTRRLSTSGPPHSPPGSGPTCGEPAATAAPRLALDRLEHALWRARQRDLERYARSRSTPPTSKTACAASIARCSAATIEPPGPGTAAPGCGARGACRLCRCANVDARAKCLYNRGLFAPRRPMNPAGGRRTRRAGVPALAVAGDSGLRRGAMRWPGVGSSFSRARATLICCKHDEPCGPGPAQATPGGRTLRTTGGRP